jgi:hypothetical protein
MLKVKIFVTAIILISVISGVVSQRHALSCELIGLSNYVEISPNVFISPEAQKNKHIEILSIISAGKKRITSTYGTMASFPKIVIATNKNEVASFAINSIGQTHPTPIGQCVVIGPDGQNIDVVSHELLHAEVVHRVGWINYKFKIPFWFGEGIATIVDHREHILVKNISLTRDKVEGVKLKDLDFFTDGNTYENYLAARLAVDKLDRTSLYKNLAKIREGEKFNDVFKL